FQAEDGIRDKLVTGVQTCALPIWLLDELATVVGLGYPVAVGPSRKRFLGAATGRPVEDRDRATAVACALAWERGARLFRVHDAALACEALRVAGATTGNGTSAP